MTIYEYLKITQRDSKSPARSGSEVGTAKRGQILATMPRECF
jgi:hypothetical protein